MSEDLSRERRHTGAVDLLVVGQRTSYLVGADLAQEIRATNFVERGSLIERCEGGEISVTPRELQENAVAVAMAKGMILNRVSIPGKSAGMFAQFNPGVLYSCLDFIEGPELEEGRWVIRFVDEEGAVHGHTLEVQVKTVIDFHPNAEDMHGHQFPRVWSHGIGHEGVARLLGIGGGFGVGLGTSDWLVTCSNWQPIGTNQDGSVMCMADCVCSGRPTLALS